MAQFDAAMAVNTRGVVLCLRAVSKVMGSQESVTYTGRHEERSLGRGSIVNVASISGLTGHPGTLAYTASKHAVMGITKAAGERVDFNIEYDADRNSSRLREGSYSRECCMSVACVDSYVDGGRKEAAGCESGALETFSIGKIGDAGGSC